MPIIYKHGDSVKFDKTVVALGTFDGLHIAHMRIIDKAKKYAVEHNINCGVLLFDKIPCNLFSKERVLSVMNLKDKKDLLINMDFIYEEIFDLEFSNISPRGFVEFLKTKLNASAVSVGYNYRFGRGADGDINTLLELCMEYDIEVLVEEKYTVDGMDVSSTIIRQKLSSGDITAANILLGRPYFISGRVSHGFGNGTKMGFPTANISFDIDLLIPKDGARFPTQR